ncbi:Six-hairpin glycosidase-like protein [Phascolomyces articulosus]|uniref:Six-hairpin glycosidase-like protein n=1 Tax=Phascolomyces articulosus TaxID=60185 RepID=A0AAD5KLP1_9FUNG|nr:Six-hairpin glycosidase-like protein [Phascolomyces articulosus]
MEHEHTNRLINEKSPYLLQHAHNPVDWYPWGEEAFTKAKQENKPIFLSVGYSTCHWCHVMEHESFENDKVAEVMNKFYVNIKVDQEENPGVDKFYMTFIQLTSGGGGWPMSVFLTPDLQPFFGGTYFPPDDRYGRPGFKSLLTRIAQIWMASPDKLINSGKSTVAQLKAYSEAKPEGDSSKATDPWSLAETTYEHFASSFDTQYGGFGKAPKFPTPVQLMFLLDYYGYHYKKEQGEKALDMVLYTLDKIHRGGIHDHIGSGFHRYSTDQKWHVPHFEKMLYDQAQLISIYSRAYQITKNESYANVARDIVQYVARDLQHKEGAFYAAEDADSLPNDQATKKLEGAFCVWEAQEIIDILGDQYAAVISYFYGIESQGNVDPAQDPHGELEGKNVLMQMHSEQETIDKFGLTKDQFNDILKQSNEKLWQHRLHQRPKPHRDDKILTSWNGLMISGLSQAGRIINEPEFISLAKRTATFIRANMYNTETGVLIRSFREGPSTIEGFLDDYSYLIQGLIDLYEATFDDQWIQWAYSLQEKQNEQFYDKDGGGYFNVNSEDKSILVRMKEEQDGAEPSGNAISVRNLIRLSTLLQKETSAYTKISQDTIESFYTELNKFPFAMPAFMSSFLLFAKGIKEVVVIGSDSYKANEFVRIVYQDYTPHLLLVRLDATQGQKDKNNNNFLCEQNSVFQDLIMKESTAAEAYICENFACGLPITNVEELKSNIIVSNNIHSNE